MSSFDLNTVFILGCDKRYEMYQTGFLFEGLGLIAWVAVGGWVKAKNPLFQNVVMWHIKLVGLKSRKMCKKDMPEHTPWPGLAPEAPKSTLYRNLLCYISN